MPSTQSSNLIGRRVMWNTGAADATGSIVAVRRDAAYVKRDEGQRNGGAVYNLYLSSLWVITDPPYTRKIAEEGSG